MKLRGKPNNVGLSEALGIFSRITTTSVQVKTSWLKSFAQEEDFKCAGTRLGAFLTVTDPSDMPK